MIEIDTLEEQPNKEILQIASGYGGQHDNQCRITALSPEFGNGAKQQRHHQ